MVSEKIPIFVQKRKKKVYLKFKASNGRKPLELQNGTKKELKSLFMRIKEDSEKAGLKLNIKKMKIMVSSPITSWQTDGGKVETVTYFILLGSKTTVDGDCSHEIKRHSLLGSKAMTNLDSMLKSRDITSLSRVCLVKSIVYGFENWTMVRGGKREEGSGCGTHVYLWRIHFDIWQN